MNREDLELNSERLEYHLNKGYQANPNRTLEDKQRFIRLAYALGYLNGEEHADSAEFYLDERIKFLDEIDFKKNKTAWVEEIRRFSAICDVVLYGKCTYISDCEEKPVSFKRKSLKDSLPNDRPSDEIKKELVPA